MGAATRAVRRRILRALARAAISPGTVAPRARRSIPIVPLAIAVVLAAFATGGPLVPSVAASDAVETTGGWGLLGLVVPIFALTALLTLALVGARLILARSVRRDEDDEDDSGE
jgi:hypothetical protein